MSKARLVITAVIERIIEARRQLVAEGGSISLRVNGRLHHIGIGRTHTGTRVILLINDLDVRIHAATGEIFRNSHWTRPAATLCVVGALRRTCRQANAFDYCLMVTVNDVGACDQSAPRTSPYRCRAGRPTGVVGTGAKGAQRAAGDRRTRYSVRVKVVRRWCNCPSRGRCTQCDLTREVGGDAPRGPVPPRCCVG